MFQAITGAKRMLICIDALDECVPEHRMVVLESLRQILQESFECSLIHDWKASGAE